jgi:hypothetical protein
MRRMPDLSTFGGEAARGLRHIRRMRDDGNDGKIFYQRVLKLGKAKGLKSGQAICRAAGLDKDFLRKIKDGENRSPSADKIRKHRPRDRRNG